MDLLADSKVFNASVSMSKYHIDTATEKVVFKQQQLFKGPTLEKVSDVLIIRQIFNSQRNAQWPYFKTVSTNKPSGLPYSCNVTTTQSSLSASWLQKRQHS